MTVLQLDQPRQLRLVSSSGRPRIRRSRYRDTANLGLESRRLLNELLRARLATGQPVDADAARVVLAARQNHHVGPAHRFTAELIWQLVFVDILSWCRTRRLNVPDGIAAALAAIVTHLHTTGQLHPSSDSIGELLTAIDECTGSDHNTTDHRTTDHRHH